MKLTPAMRTALEHAARQPLRRLHDDQPGKPPWPAPAATLYALVRHGLLEHGQRRNRRGWPLDEWTLSDAGRRALEPVHIVKQDVPLYLAHCGAIRYRKLPSGRWAVDTSGDGRDDYTTDPRKSIDSDYAPGSRKATAVEVLVGPEDVERFAAHARKREKERQRQNGLELDKQPLVERLERARLAARDHHMAFSGEARLIRHLIAQGRTQTAVDRLSRVEAQLGQRAA